MADCSLDDYIKQKGIGLNFKRTAAGIKTSTAATRTKILSPNGKKPFVKKPITAPSSTKLAQRFDARQWLSDPVAKTVGILPKKIGAASRLGSAPTANVRAVPRLGGAPVPSLIPGPNTGGPVSDARQKILAKTKFADARQRIANKKLEKEGTVPPLFDVRQKLEAKRGLSVPPLFPQSVQHAPVSLFAPQETRQPFAWSTSVSSPGSQQVVVNLGSSVVKTGSQQGVMNFGGNIVKTVNYPTAPLMPVPQPLMANRVESHTPNTQILQNNAKLQITMKNDQRAAHIVSMQRPLQQTVFALPMSSRIGFGKVADAQPIQTVVSQPPIKVVPQTLVTTKPRLPATSAKQSEVEMTSPLQGYRIQVSNLHPNVSHEDITNPVEGCELFGAVGALKRARLVKAGHAEVVYVNREDAVAAVAKYHMRELDGVPMNLVLEDRKSALTTALSDLQQHQPLKLNKTVPTQVVDLDPTILYKALFKTSSDQLAPVKPVSFTVHM